MISNWKSRYASLLLASLANIVNAQDVEYVSGASVFLDINYNGEFELNEPSAISGITGNYISDLNAADTTCLGYAPIIVDVPVGAKSKSGKTVATAYKLTIPISAQSRTEKADTLTKIVKQALTADSFTESSPNSCEQAIQLATFSKQTENLIDDAIYHAIEHYNLSAKSMLRVLTNAKDASELKLGRQILAGITSSVKETQALQSKHPNAIWARVSFHVFDDRDADARFPDAWYRETNLNDNGVQEFHLQKMDDALSLPLHTIIYGKRSSRQLNDLRMSESTEIESRQGNYNAYTCDVKETVITNHGNQEIELVNLAGGDAEPLQGCTVNRHFHGRYVFINETRDGAQLSAQFYFERRGDQFAFLPQWENYEKRGGYFDGNELIEFAKSLPYSIEQTDMAGSAWWVKSKTYNTSDGRVREERSTFSGWRRELTRADGTQSTTCSSDGNTWRDC